MRMTCTTDGEGVQKSKNPWVSKLFKSIKYLMIFCTVICLIYAGNKICQYDNQRRINSIKKYVEEVLNSKGKDPLKLGLGPEVCDKGTELKVCDRMVLVVYDFYDTEVYTVTMWHWNNDSYNYTMREIKTINKEVE